MVTVEYGPLPMALMACTRNRYLQPLVNPVTVWLVAVELNTLGVPVQYPTYGVTTYPVITEPPSDAGGVHDTVACPFPAVAAPIVGAPGAVDAVGVTVLVAVE